MIGLFYYKINSIKNSLESKGTSSTITHIIGSKFQTNFTILRCVLQNEQCLALLGGSYAHFTLRVKVNFEHFWVTNWPQVTNKC